MTLTPSRYARSAVRSFFLLALSMLAACMDGTGSDPARIVDDPALPSGTVAVLHCTAHVASAAVECEPKTPSSGSGLGNGARANLHLLGGQGVYVRLASFGTSYDAATKVLSSYVTVQNLTDQVFATDSVSRNDEGVRVFFAVEPTITGGSSVTPVSVLNYTGIGVYTGAGQKYFQYGGKIGGFDDTALGADGMLGSAETSGARQWQFSVESTVTSFAFTVYVATHTPPGALNSLAPQVTGVSPATLVPGASATITGFNFNATPDLNSVRIGGVGAPITGGGAGFLTVTVPCVTSGTATVTVAKRPENSAGDPLVGATYLHPLHGNLRTLAPGQAAVMTDASQAACTELAPANGPAAYVVAVYNTTVSPAAATSFALVGDVAGGTPAAPQAQRAPSSRAVPSGGAPAGLRHPDAELQAAQLAEERHTRLLEMNRSEYRRLFQRFGPANRLRADRSRPAFVTAPALSRGFRVADIDAADPCNSYYSLTATRVYYSGKIAIYEDDATPAALKAAANAQMADYYQKIGDQFDADMEPMIRDNFGDVLRRDAEMDDNGVLIALFTPRVNNTFPGVAGFVVSCDLYPNDAGNASSNFGEVFYAYQPTSTGTGYGALTPDSWYWSIRATFVHEAKHVASYVAHAANGYPFFEDTWLEEGLARQAEELWARQSIYNVAWKGNTGYGSAASPGSLWCDYRQTTPACLTNPRRPSLNMSRHFQGLYDYMLSPGNHSPFGPVSGTGGSSFYGSSWSLIRYSLDRYGTSEAAFLTALTQAGTTGMANLAAHAGVPAEQLLGGWALSLYADDYPGLASPSPETQIPTWTLASIFAGMHADFPGTFTETYPLAPQTVGFGPFTPLNVTNVAGGGVAYFELTGTQNAPQLLKLTSLVGGAPPSNLRVAVARVK